MRPYVVGSVIALSMVACADEEGAMRQNIGKSACNTTNGVYIGRIVDVTRFSAAGQASSLVYVTERDGRRRNSPPGNVSIAARCPDGLP